VQKAERKVKSAKRKLQKHGATLDTLALEKANRDVIAAQRELYELNQQRPESDSADPNQATLLAAVTASSSTPSSASPTQQ
jgi:hypothetical protein